MMPVSVDHVSEYSGVSMNPGATPELITGPGSYRSLKSARFAHSEVSFHSTLRDVTYSSFPCFVQILV